MELLQHSLSSSTPEGRGEAESLGSNPDRLDWHTSVCQILLVIKTRQSWHLPGWSTAWRACSSPRQFEQTPCGSLLEIRFPQGYTLGFKSPGPLVEEYFSAIFLLECDDMVRGNSVAHSVHNVQVLGPWAKLW